MSLLDGVLRTPPSHSAYSNITSIPGVVLHGFPPGGEHPRKANAANAAALVPVTFFLLGGSGSYPKHKPVFTWPLFLRTRRPMQAHGGSTGGGW